MIEAAVNGDVSCCEVHADLKQFETIIKAGLKVIKDGAVSEAREFDKGDRYYGGTWQIRASATLLQYDDDQTYKDFAAHASERKKLLNAAWKHKNEGHGFFVTEDGEEMPILKVKTPSSEAAIWKATEPKGQENDGKTGLAF
ncbi:MAG: hypothetical protein V3W20_11245 [Candidatus Neomarinimicrobiota bacterium]